MSGLIVGLVLRLPITEEFNSEAKFIATVYADHAWEDGSHAYPAVETVAKITGFSDRTIQRYLRLLEKTLLTLDGKGPRGTNRYKFTLLETNGGSIGLVTKEGDTQSPRQAVGGDRVSGDRVSGDTSVIQTNNPSLVLVVNDAEIAKVAKFYEQEIGVLTPLIADAIRDACKEYPADWIPEAITIAVEGNARRWNYVLAILKNCKAAGKRPSLNRLEKKDGSSTHQRGNSRSTKSQGQAKADNPRYSAADLAAAERVKSNKRKPASVS